MKILYSLLFFNFFYLSLYVNADPSVNIKIDRNAESSANPEFVVTLRSGYTERDKHHDYGNELLQLALEKTRKKYGDFRLQDLPRLNYVRTLKAAVDNSYPNLFFEANYDQSLSTDGGLTFISFPVDLGVIGHRVCFINPKLKESGKQFRTLEDLKPYTFAHGIAWADTQIFRHNGLTVREIENYDGLFLMIISGRIDFFCRGANEVLDERNQFKELDLVIDDSFMLVYPLPRFFYTNSKNVLAKERIELGINLAYTDGSLKKLWLKHFSASLKYVNPGARNIIPMENPLLGDLKFKEQPDFIYLLQNETQNTGGPTKTPQRKP
ncbi:MAG: hypothetical protein V4660_19590 [Pseudomonadota bacterium]